ncbi:MAG: hypothetical protein AAF317_13455 [Pseudomonadota bacterium]
MSGDDHIGWIMLASVSVMGLLVLMLLYMPETRPEAAILECDRQGGVWSTETRHCEKSDSPLAGMAS